MIIIKELLKRYHNKTVIDIENFTINDGDVFGLVGNNGAGKSTLFQLMLDLIKADKGVVFFDEWITSKSENWKDFTGSYLNEGFLIDFLSPEEFFYFVGNTCGLTKTDIDKKLEMYDSFFNDEILKQKGKYIRNFSKGNKQKIGIVSALLNEPAVLIFDEPFDGLDPSSQIVLKNIIIAYSKLKKSSILISSHDLNHITDICNRIAIIEKGLIVKDIENNENTLHDLQSYFNII